MEEGVLLTKFMDIVSIKNRLDELYKTWLDVSRDEFYKGIQCLFEKYPTFLSVGWQQSSPYNDGEEIVFRCRARRSPDVEFNASENDAETKGACEKTLREFFCIFDDELYKRLFGESSSVTITREGIKIEGFCDC